MDRAGHRVFVRRVCAGHERRNLAGGGGIMQLLKPARQAGKCMEENFV